MEIRVNGQTLLPLHHGDRIAFVKKRLLEPFADEPEGYQLYEREGMAGDRKVHYIAVKRGLFLIGILDEYRAKLDELASALEEMATMCRVRSVREEK